MNLLKVQDALKNASDQQLMTLMQAPDSTAPSYLVLSEIRRRKDMRAKQTPEGQPNRTVAEELTAPEAPAGIRGLQPQMDPDGVDAAEGGDVQGMAAGGIVRMQEGGPTTGEEEIPPPPPDAPPVPRERGGLGSLAMPRVETDRVPTLAEVMRRNAELFPDNMGTIRDRIREERVDPAARRGEAANMALIEAGLRIAGSRNPSLIGAIGEGALPAVQGYNQQLGQIRTEQRQARQDELELAKQEINRQFAVGQISASEHRNLTSEVGLNNRMRQQLAAQAAISARSDAAADRRYDREIAGRRETARLEGRMSFDDFMALPEDQRRNYLEFHGRGRSDVAGAAPTLAAATRELQNLRTRLADLGPEPSRTTGWMGNSNPAHARWEQESAALRAQITDAEALSRAMEEILRTGGRGRTQASGVTATPNATNPSDPFGLR